MRPHRLQQTLSNSFHVAGHGYWSGSPVTVSFQPAASNTGIRFRRVDLPGTPSVLATAEHRQETALRTRLTNDRCSVDMVEHVMAALHAAHIDNCLIDCTAQEMPGLDGSSIRFSLGIEQAGITSQETSAHCLEIEQAIRVGNEEQWVMAIPSDEPGLICEYRLDYGQQSVIPQGTFVTSLDSNRFLHEVAPARTFVTQEEADSLQRQGLAKHVTHQDLLVFGPKGPIENSLRFENECARHKLLDLVGDLALSGVSLQGRIVACRSGHVLNGRMAMQLREVAKLKSNHPLVETNSSKTLFKRAA